MCTLRRAIQYTFTLHTCPRCTTVLLYTFSRGPCCTVQNFIVHLYMLTLIALYKRVLDTFRYGTMHWLFVPSTGSKFFLFPIYSNIFCTFWSTTQTSKAFEPLALKPSYCSLLLRFWCCSSPVLFHTSFPDTSKHQQNLRRGIPNMPMEWPVVRRCYTTHSQILLRNWVFPLIRWSMLSSEWFWHRLFEGRLSCLSPTWKWSRIVHVRRSRSGSWTFIVFSNGAAELSTCMI